MSRSSSLEAPLRWVFLALPLFVLAACAAPPNKEIGEAQKALQAAKDAGAERYAFESYKAAAESYRLANEAVLKGDYRLALAKALESREHSQTAARDASDENVRARQQANEWMADVAALLVQINTRLLEAADRPGTPRRVITDARRTVTQVSGNVQEASAAVRASQFAKAQPILATVKARLEKTLAALEAATPQSSKRRQ